MPRYYKDKIYNEEQRKRVAFFSRIDAMVRRNQIDKAFFDQFGHDGSRVQVERHLAQFHHYAELSKRGDKL